MDLDASLAAKKILPETPGVVERLGTLRRPSSIWTPALVEELRARWAEGQSATQIAAIFGCTRNAIISKVHRIKAESPYSAKNGNFHSKKGWTATEDAELIRLRKLRFAVGAIASMLRKGHRTVSDRLKKLGLSRSYNGNFKTRSSKYTGSFASIPGAPAARPAPIEIEPPQVRRVKLLDLQKHHCRWPLGHPDESEFAFCGADRSGSSSYCEYHAHVAFAPKRGHLDHLADWVR